MSNGLSITWGGNVLSRAVPLARGDGATTAWIGRRGDDSLPRAGDEVSDPFTLSGDGIVGALTFSGSDDRGETSPSCKGEVSGAKSILRGWVRGESRSDPSERLSVSKSEASNNSDRSESSVGTGNWDRVKNGEDDLLL